MNGTLSFYNEAQLAVLPLAPLLVCPLVSIIIYWLARRRLTSSQPLKSRARLFYLMLSGNLLGYALSHITAFANAIYVALGYFILWSLEELAGRAWNDNVHYIGPADGTAPDDIGLNKQTMELDDVYVCNDVTATGDFARSVTLVVAQAKDKRKRQWMLLTLFLLLIIVSFVDGLYLIYRAPSNESDVARLIACYYVNAISLSVCVYGAMIHAKMHVLENKRTRLILWSSLTAVWCISLFLGSNLMVLLRVQWSWAAYVLHSQPALIALYGIACGMCLRMQAYFFVMKQDDATNTERKDIVLGVIVYLLALAQSIGTSLYI